MKTEEIPLNAAKPSLGGRVTKAASGHQQKKRYLRRVVPLVGAATLLGLLVYGFWPEPAPVETARASMGSLRVSINEEGKTRIKNRFAIAAPVAGQLKRIDLKAGAVVQANKTVVAVIEPLSPSILDARTRASAEARRETAAANLQRAEASQKYAASELARVEKLSQAQTVSAQELESAQFRETAAAKDLAAAQSNLRQAEAELAEFSGGNKNNKPVELTSPITGRVLHVFEESSRPVGTGTPLLEVGDPTDLEAVIEVLSRDGAGIQPGTRVQLEQWGGSKPLEAGVRLVEPAAFTKISALGVEEQRVNVVADILTPLAERGSLGDNFRVEGRIVVTEINNALKVPSGAVFRTGEKQAVFLLKNGKATWHQVSVGASSPTESQILNGLKEGDAVIVYPGDRVKDGDRVKAIQVSAQ